MGLAAIGKMLCQEKIDLHGKPHRPTCRHFRVLCTYPRRYAPANDISGPSCHAAPLAKRVSSWGHKRVLAVGDSVRYFVATQRDVAVSAAHKEMRNPLAEHRQRPNASCAMWQLGTGKLKTGRITKRNDVAHRSLIFLACARVTTFLDFDLRHRAASLASLGFRFHGLTLFSSASAVYRPHDFLLTQTGIASPRQKHADAHNANDQ
jgi:hypothetical protein